jgi:hypothetical protein
MYGEYKCRWHSDIHAAKTNTPQDPEKFFLKEKMCSGKRAGFWMANMME